MNRLKQSELKAFRAKRLEEQGGKCVLCGRPLAIEDAVVDHDHKTGLVRGVIHRGCNCLLGKCENNYRRYCIPDLTEFLVGAADYLDDASCEHAFSDREPVYHPSFRTEDEKRLRRNKKAKQKRKARNESKTKKEKQA